MRRHQTSQFQCGVRSAAPPHCQDATFHVATICGALRPRCCDRPSWNTQHLPFVNPVLYYWSVFNAPTSHQRMLSSAAGSWKRRSDPTASLELRHWLWTTPPGWPRVPAALTLRQHWHCRLLFTCHASKCRPVQWGNVWPHSVGWKIKWKQIFLKSKWVYQRLDRMMSWVERNETDKRHREIKFLLSGGAVSLYSCQTFCQPLS